MYKSKCLYLCLKILISGVVILWAFIVIYPLVWISYNSLKTNSELFKNVFVLPQKLNFHNYYKAWKDGNIGTSFVNSIFVTSFSVISELLISAMAAYPIARFNFKGKNFLHTFFVSGMMFPIFLGVVPLFFLLDNFGLLDSLWGLNVVYISFGIPFGIFILRPFFETIPRELEEAAIIDGCSQFRLFFTIMLPLAKPGLVSLAIFEFIRIWNEYFFALIIITRQSLSTLPLGIYQLYRSQEYVADWVTLMAGLVIVLIPIMVVYLLFQETFKEGLMAGSLKG